jgi:subfamily B ATP-binding cassette protein MsbA
MPLLRIIFQEDKVINKVKPIYNGITEADVYFNDYFSYWIYTIVGEDKQKMLVLVIALIVVVFFLKNLFSYLAFYFITFLKNGVLKDIRDELYEKTISLPVSYFSEKRKGDIMSRIGPDVIEVHYSFLSILELIFRDPLMILVTIGVMLILSTKLTLFVFIFLPVAGFLINVVGKNLKKTSDKVQKEQGIFLSLLEETLSGLRVLKAFNAYHFFQSRFGESTSRFEKLSNKVMIKTQLASPVSEILAIIVISVLIWYGGSLVLVDKSMDGGAFITYIALAYNIITPAKSISKASFTIKKGNAAAERILQILDTEDPLADKEDAVDKQELTSEIAFNNISFKYEEGYVLKDFSLTVPKGTSVALVGQSGSGKSTLANLVTRFYDVNEGSITIDGVDVRDIKKKSLLGMMGIVTQDSILFNDSVANNIKLGNQNATSEEIVQASKIANAHEFVTELPEHYDSNIADGGNKLSGGQKQRLSIARAVLKNPPIMVLDEATSALDTESEQLVQQALEKMMENRTSLVIAHRLSTIQNADNIVVLRKGQIVEQGKHEELMEKQGEYFKLVSMQNLE